MKELEDQSWFPDSLRNFQTEYIGYVVTRFNIYGPFIKIFQEKKAGLMYDLCSGCGQPALSIFKQSKNFQKLSLSDKFPYAFGSEYPDVEYIKESKDVLNMDFEAGKTYTMFNAFHHFSEDEQRTICLKIREANASAYFVEILFPSLLHLSKILIATTVGVLILSPFIKPFSWKRILFTYIIPVNILTISIDGIISVLKSKTVKQYQKTLKLSGLNVFEIKHFLAPLLVIQIDESN
jgi:hypothetical protein